jgi:tRNA/tmRNA/rRNA uracil-C5-methylase (TrmA/RlmC/RlmD family)
VATGHIGEFRDSLAWFDSSGLAGIEVIVGEESLRLGDTRMRYDHARGGLFDLHFEPGVFTQANTAVNNAVVEAVMGALLGSGKGRDSDDALGAAGAEGEPGRAPGGTSPDTSSTRILELHAGVGNFSLPLALAGAEVYAVEHLQRAVSLAQHNAQAAGAALHAFVLEDIEALEEGGPVPSLTEFDAVLLDPPRIGAHAVARRLAADGPGRIVYVSCDPATLARDVKELVDAGYEIAEATAFDMFPQTPHVEAMLRLERT